MIIDWDKLLTSQTQSRAKTLRSQNVNLNPLNSLNNPLQGNVPPLIVIGGNINIGGDFPSKPINPDLPNVGGGDDIVSSRTGPSWNRHAMEFIDDENDIRIPPEIE